MDCRTAQSLSCLMLPVTNLLPKKPLLQNDSRASSQASLLLFSRPSGQYCGRHIKKTLPLPPHLSLQVDWTEFTAGERQRPKVWRA